MKYLIAAIVIIAVFVVYFLIGFIWIIAAIIADYRKVFIRSWNDVKKEFWDMFPLINIVWILMLWVLITSKLKKNWIAPLNVKGGKE